jgi:3-oxoacyl-[acyl-carrier-protein] synthase-3
MKAGRLRMDTGRRRLLGWGSVYPGEPVSTAQLCEKVQALSGLRTLRQGQWLGDRLGVKTRHLCRDFVHPHEAPRPGARNPELAAQALQLALHRAGLGPDPLSYLISHTTTPGQLLPAGSAEIARLTGHTGAHMELRQACTGFANALQVAFAMTAQPGSAPVGIVGVETGSVFFDPASLQAGSAQWVNLLQMGDGAAAVIIGPDDAASMQPCMGHAYFGQCQDPPSPGLCLPKGGSDDSVCEPGVLHFQHDFTGVMNHGLTLLAHGRAALAQVGYSVRDAHCVVPHQASGALAPWLAQQWNLPTERICAHAAQVGNLGSASIWAALDHVLQERHLQRDEVALFLGAEATQYSYGGFVLEMP